MHRLCTENNGARLRRLVKEIIDTKLHDSKPLGGKGCLTKSEIRKLQNYYGLAIRSSVNSLEAVKRSVWAVFFHKLSTNGKSQHGLCPTGDDSSCKFRNSASSGLPYEHKHSLTAAVIDAIKPVFSDLASADLLKRCHYGTTEIPDEHVNSVIWARMTNTVFVRPDTLKFVVYNAILCFYYGAAKKE
jgi:hypothetical protein